MACPPRHPKIPPTPPTPPHLSYPAACRGSLEDEVSLRMQEVRQAVQDAEAEEAAAGRDDSTGEGGCRTSQRCAAPSPLQPPFCAAAVGSLPCAACLSKPRC